MKNMLMLFVAIAFSALAFTSSATADVPDEPLGFVLLVDANDTDGLLKLDTDESMTVAEVAFMSSGDGLILDSTGSELSTLTANVMGEVPGRLTKAVVMLC